MLLGEWFRPNLAQSARAAGPTERRLFHRFCRGTIARRDQSSSGGGGSGPGDRRAGRRLPARYGGDDGHQGKLTEVLGSPEWQTVGELS